MRLCATVAVLTLTATLCAAAQFPVLDGDTQAVIVVEKNAAADTSSAAGELAAYLKKSTGRDFRVVNERDFDASTSDARPIYVGRCRPVKRLCRL